MKNVSYATFLLIATLSVSSWMCVTIGQKTKMKFKITGSIMQTISYCGGARPTQQILDSFNTPKGIPYGRLFVKEGGKNTESATIIDTIGADGNGNFSIDLPAGNYCLVEEWKSKPYKLPLNNKNQTVDAICFRNLYNACDYQLQVTTENIANVKVVFHRKCFFNQPCISYHGPLPPMAPPH